MNLQNTNQIIPYGPTSRLYSVNSTLVFIQFGFSVLSCIYVMKRRNEYSVYNIFKQESHMVLVMIEYSQGSRRKFLDEGVYFLASQFRVLICNPSAESVSFFHLYLDISQVLLLGILCL